MSPSTRILLSLVAGLVGGVALAAAAPDATGPAIAFAQPIGTAWLHALQMTVVPLVVSLLVTGVAATAEAAQAGRLAARAIAAFVLLLMASAIVAAVLMPWLLDLFPLPAEAAARLRAALVGLSEPAVVPTIGDLVEGVVPTNALAAAVNDAFLPLILFTLVFAFAITRLEAALRAPLIALFTALREAMLVVIGWVLWLAPVGVLALALVVGARAGTAAFGALLHYLSLICAVGIAVAVAGPLLALIGSRLNLARFAHAALPAQAVAFSTQSSLASLPAMLRGAGAIGVAEAQAGIILPLAVAVFRWTGPAMNLGVAIYVARWFGVVPSFGTMVAAVTVAGLTSLGTVSLPGQISFVSAITPIAAVLGAPLLPLGLLVAVETIPDIIRTVGNVTMDLAVARRLASEPAREG
ncbi:hypothetical protein GCM10011380_15060 [Sphingomonas metalli]|uniref:Cation:dicarboxylase symporter family transporter n=1 Tax=Sphingomonas metalli TaxID=1779358 RepID=A0A916WSI4_9SPHN|nr:cation:dicarboxylase symporter family transporter [Sphingomonas metalli]GGB26542.1 hypothetical protein GCM10011380_15060 [Sphingomonas metalli]